MSRLAKGLLPWILVWLLPQPCRSLTWKISSIYCQFSDFCECDFRPNIDGLECDLSRYLYGQHLVKEIVLAAIRQYTESANPEKPLVLSFHGWSGTGKTYVTSMLVKHLYGRGFRSPNVHQFVPTLHFPHAGSLMQYQKDLESWIVRNLTACQRSIFIFDEMDKMFPGLIDVIMPFLGSHCAYCRRALFIFIGNAGGEQINQLVLDSWRNRKEREDIDLHGLEAILSEAVYNNPKSGFWKSKIIEENWIDHFVPFLPLVQRHVKQCVKMELGLRQVTGREDVVQAVTDAMNYFPKQEKLFSQTGCKTVGTKVDFYL
ncbi:prosalusin [Latimeria chalumnae]|nr:PREDICTED: prosalusin [Latimeria chalumnae]|eukprot:XP_005992207.1 PREDICTED: prosalusin [Latimeria chalumnae]